MAAHVEGGVQRASLGPSGFNGGVGVSTMTQLFLAVEGRRGHLLRWLLDAALVETLMKDFVLVGKVARDWLVALG